LIPRPPKRRATSCRRPERRLLAALRQLLEERQVYREERLTIGELARRLGTREHVLRRVINQGLGYRNFNEFLHAHRIREACERLRRAEDARLPILSIALGVGYSSIGPFNRAFKARIGMTPTRYRRSADRGSQSAA
jgi:AraC-like DNA-binding protein